MKYALLLNAAALLFGLGFGLFWLAEGAFVLYWLIGLYYLAARAFVLGVAYIIGGVLIMLLLR